MSSQLFSTDVVFLQRFLKCAGFLQGPASGEWDSETDAAHTAFDLRTEAIATQHGRFDARTERNLATLHPRAQELARIFLTTVRTSGIDARVISGTRTYAEQDALYRQGRWGNPGKVVTKAKGGQSNHNFGIAWDIGIFVNGAYIANDIKPYAQAAKIGLVTGLEWGGAWKTLPDPPHYQVATSLNTDVVRVSFEGGMTFV